MYAELVDRGDAELDTSAVVKLYESAAPPRTCKRRRDIVWGL